MMGQFATITNSMTYAVALRISSEMPMPQALLCAKILPGIC
jgi:hypothetical protein